MRDEELLKYFRTMRSTERLAVLPNQFPAFLAGVSTSIDLDIHRVDGVFYVKDLIHSEGVSDV